MKIIIEETVAQEFDVDLDINISTEEGLDEAYDAISEMYYKGELTLDNAECQGVKVQLNSDLGPDSPWAEL